MPKFKVTLLLVNETGHRTWQEYIFCAGSSGGAVNLAIREMLQTFKGYSPWDEIVRQIPE